MSGSPEKSRESQNAARDYAKENDAIAKDIAAKVPDPKALDALISKMDGLNPREKHDALQTLQGEVNRIGANALMDFSKGCMAFLGGKEA